MNHFLLLHFHPMVNVKQKSPARKYYYLCSYELRCGDCESVYHELPRVTNRPFTLRDYVLELREFCEGHETKRQRVAWLKEQRADFGDVEFWPYDDRLYRSPVVQELTKREYEVLSRFLRC